MDSDELLLRAVGVAGGLVVSALGATLRYEIEGAEHYRDLRRAGRPMVFAFWHSRLLPLVHLHRHEDVVALVSEHRDGEYIARVMRRCGLGSARGSSTRGGARGMRELLRAARRGSDLAITPDGPKGPARRFKEGPLILARLGGLPIIPTAIGGDRVWRLGSWDRFMVPKPFARMRVRYAEPVHVPRRAADGELERLRLRLEATLDRITDEVDGLERDSGAPSAPVAESPGGSGR
jgi:lysophospholipid acyltransferase (LPLAT)-like uncharacterized protein